MTLGFHSTLSCVGHKRDGSWFDVFHEVMDAFRQLGEHSSLLEYSAALGYHLEQLYVKTIYVIQLCKMKLLRHKTS